MKTSPASQRRKPPWFGCAVPLLACAGLLAVNGCSTFSGAGSALGSYRPDNVHCAATTLPDDVMRVAVLPLASESVSHSLGEGCAALDAVVHGELMRMKRFEVAGISQARLRDRTGRLAWTGEEVLPTNFFAVLREETGCDAVLFCQLTVFRAHAPLAIGWRFRLVDTRSQETLWAADEVFDAGQPPVARGAQRFDRTADGWAVLNSPRRFGAYSAAALLATLPERGTEKPLKSL